MDFVANQAVNPLRRDRFNLFIVLSMIAQISNMPLRYNHVLADAALIVATAGLVLRVRLPHDLGHVCPYAT